MIDIQRSIDRAVHEIACLDPAEQDQWLAYFCEAVEDEPLMSSTALERLRSILDERVEAGGW